MYNRYLFSFINIALLFTTTYASYDYYDNYSCEYCKDDICVPCNNRVDIGTVIIPNKAGVNVTYISDTCSTKDIDLDLCTSKTCTTDSECLSNKCTKNHCSFNEANPIVQCFYVRTVHSNPILGEPKGYKRQCGLPVGDKCKSNKDCSSFNCEKYSGSDSVCGTPDNDSGCHSACGIGAGIVVIIAIPSYIILSSCLCCGCCYYRKHQHYRNFIKYASITVIILSAIPWIIILSYDMHGVLEEDGSISEYIIRIIIIIVITIIIVCLICFVCKNNGRDSDDENLQTTNV